MLLTKRKLLYVKPRTNFGKPWKHTTTRLRAHLHTEMSFKFCGKMPCVTVAPKCGLNAMVLRLTESVMVARSGPLMIQLNRHLCFDLIKRNAPTSQLFNYSMFFRFYFFHSYSTPQYLGLFKNSMIKKKSSQERVPGVEKYNRLLVIT